MSSIFKAHLKLNKILHNFNKRVLSSDILRYDIVIVGGGPVGSSIALHLAKLSGTKSVLVIERDNTYRIASASLSAGGIRQQFSLPENIKMCIYGAEFLKNVDKTLYVEGQDIPNIQFKENGYLFLSESESNSKILKENHKIQSECGVDWIKLLDANALKSHFPWLGGGGGTKDTQQLGSYSVKNEGYFDPWSLVSFMKKKASSLGVTYLEGEVVGATISKDAGAEASYYVNTLRVVQTSSGKPVPNKPILQIQAGFYINAAGAWAGKFVEMLRSFSPVTYSSLPGSTPAKNSSKNKIHSLPVEARKRPSSSNTGIPSPPATSPLTIFSNGVYFRPEGGKDKFIAGVSPKEENDPECREDSALNTVDTHLFDEVIWPTLYEKVPSFERLKVVSSWAGFYDHNTLDQNAIIGAHTELKNLYLCNGFSGHGLQQAPAAGRAIAELVEYTSYRSLDLSRLSFDRIVNNSPIRETGIV